MEGKLPDTSRRLFVCVGDDKQVFNLAVQHCQLFDLEEPVKIEDINITQIANLAVDDAMKTRPLMEEKRMKKSDKQR